MTRPFFSQNDTLIIQILQEQGVLHKLAPTPPFTECHYGFQHRDCWWLATRHAGHTAEHDNGYTLVGLPTDLFSHKEASKFFAELIHDCQTKDGRIEFREYELCPVINQ